MNSPKLATCYCYLHKGQKIVGGSLPDMTLDEAMDYIANFSDVEAVVTNSGRVKFMRKAKGAEDKEINIYLYVKPEYTEKGKAALAKWEEQKKKERKLEAEKQALHDEKLSQIMQLAENIGLDAALRKLEE